VRVPVRTLAAAEASFLLRARGLVAACRCVLCGECLGLSAHKRGLSLLGPVPPRLPGSPYPLERELTARCCRAPQVWSYKGPEGR
jgi:hypothetical protein